MSRKRQPSKCVRGMGLPLQVVSAPTPPSPGPGTPLPWHFWHFAGQGILANSDGDEIIMGRLYDDGDAVSDCDSRDAAYIVASANAYPALVEIARLLSDRDCEAIGHNEPCLPCMARAALAEGQA